MSLRELMLEELARGLQIIRDGHELVPAWHITTPEGQFVILTRFDPDEPDQRERMLMLVPRFMAWKLATSFVLTAETWLGPERTRSGEEAIATIGVSQTAGRNPAHSQETGAGVHAPGVDSAPTPSTKPIFNYSHLAQVR